MNAHSGVGAILDARPEATPEALERELLDRLGLSVEANAQQVETAHDELIAFLESAPHELRGWSQRQIAIADEAYALLSDPTAFAGARELASLAESAPQAARGKVFRTNRSRPSADRDAPPARADRTTSPSPGAPTHASRPVRRVLLAALGIVAAVVVVFTVYASGAPTIPGVTGTPAPEAPTQGLVDNAQVAALMQKIQADPADVVSLQALGDLYFQAGDYVTATEWETKVLAIEPKNLTALLGLGAANFNKGNATEAEKQWRAVLEIDPLNLEAHYDLGFMYFSQDPPDIERTTAEWNSVIEIAPDSDIAKTVATHLETLQNWAPSQGRSGSPAEASSAPASSPAPSVVGSPAASAVAP